jgi:hypothetical protein
MNEHEDELWNEINRIYSSVENIENRFLTNPKVLKHFGSTVLLASTIDYINSGNFSHPFLYSVGINFGLIGLTYSYDLQRRLNHANNLALIGWQHRLATEHQSNQNSENIELYNWANEPADN